MFNKFNNIEAWMLDSINHMTLKLFWNHILAGKHYGFAICLTFKASFQNISQKSVNQLVVYRF